ncbi:hypothetical protein B484DRAFT_469953 [Ochromonadaceae sp. CCMP2298]|nr:hypothetical protein B484DRAFT_469953 [Ochromonadaceae sp. CCMP2298]
MLPSITEPAKAKPKSKPRGEPSGGLPTLLIGKGTPTLELGHNQQLVAAVRPLQDRTDLTTDLFKVRRGLLSLAAAQQSNPASYPALVAHLKALNWQGPPLPVDKCDDRASFDAKDLFVLRAAHLHVGGFFDGRLFSQAEARVKLWDATERGALADHLAAEISREISQFRRFQHNVFNHHEPALRQGLQRQEFSDKVFLTRGAQSDNYNNPRSRKGPLYEAPLRRSAPSGDESSEASSSTASMQRVLSSFVTSKRSVSLATVSSTVQELEGDSPHAVWSTLLIRDTAAVDFLKSSRSMLPDSELDVECARLDTLRTQSGRTRFLYLQYFISSWTCCREVNEFHASMLVLTSSAFCDSHLRS